MDIFAWHAFDWYCCCAPKLGKFCNFFTTFSGKYDDAMNTHVQALVKNSLKLALAHSARVRQHGFSFYFISPGHSAGHRIMEANEAKNIQQMKELHCFLHTTGLNTFIITKLQILNF